MSVWQHVFPPFDAWWPNIIASVVWATPAFVISHVVHKRHADRRHTEVIREIEKTRDGHAPDDRI
jgi:hypothetical protein